MYIDCMHIFLKDGFKVFIIFNEVLEIFQSNENKERKFVIAGSREQDRLKDTFKIARIESKELF